MRGAARGWKDEYASKVALNGYLPVKSAPKVFAHSVRSLRCVVHGDDFTFAGLEKDLGLAVGKIKSWYEVKVRGALGLRLATPRKTTPTTGESGGQTKASS